jgi:hypothetical protein
MPRSPFNDQVEPDSPEHGRANVFIFNITVSPQGVKQSFFRSQSCHHSLEPLGNIPHDYLMPCGLRRKGLPILHCTTRVHRAIIASIRFVFLQQTQSDQMLKLVAAYSAAAALAVLAVFGTYTTDIGKTAYTGLGQAVLTQGYVVTGGNTANTVAQQ